MQGQSCQTVLSVDLTLAANLTDWAKIKARRAGTSASETREASKTIDALINVYLSERKTLADSGQIAVSTYSSERFRLSVFLSFCHSEGKALLPEVLNSQFLDEYRASLLDSLAHKENSPTSVKNLLGTLKTTLQWCYEHELIESLPRNTRTIAAIKLPDPNPQSYTPEEVKRLFNDASERTRLYILLALNCGYTQMDISTLDHRMIDWKTAVVTRPRHKTGQDSKSKLWPITLELLRKHATAKQGLVLIGENGNPLLENKIKSDGTGTKTDSISLAFNRLIDHLNGPLLRETRPELFAKVKGQEASKNRQTEIRRALIGLRKNDKRSFKTFRKTGADAIAKQFQDKPWLIDLYLAHSPKGMAKHYAKQHFDELFKATDWLATVYGLDG